MMLLTLIAATACAKGKLEIKRPPKTRMGIQSRTPVSIIKSHNHERLADGESTGLWLKSFKFM
jgi:hypothetical protein